MSLQPGMPVKITFEGHGIDGKEGVFVGINDDMESFNRFEVVIDNSNYILCADQIKPLFKWGDEVEVQDVKESGFRGAPHKFIGMNPNPKSQRPYIVKQDIDKPIAVHAIRHPKKKVPLELDEEVIQSARIATEHKTLVKSANFNGMNVTEICEAIVKAAEKDHD